MEKEEISPKKQFINLCVATLESVSNDAEAAREYLESEGFDVDELLKEGMEEINKIKAKLENGKPKPESE